MQADSSCQGYKHMWRAQLISVNEWLICFCGKKVLFDDKRENVWKWKSIRSCRKTQIVIFKNHAIKCRIGTLLLTSNNWLLPESLHVSQTQDQLLKSSKRSTWSLVFLCPLWLLVRKYTQILAMQQLYPTVESSYTPPVHCATCLNSFMPLLILSTT